MRNQKRLIQAKWISLLAGLVLVGGCGGADGVDTTTSVPATTQVETTATTQSQTTTTASPTSTTGAETTTTTAAPTTTSTTAQTTTTAEAPSTTSLPGEPFGIAPRAGSTMAVIGVAHDDVLNLRAAPGTDQPIVAGLGPTQADMIATGRSRIVRETIWFELEAGSVVGWAASAFLGYLGVTDDLTSRIVADLGEIPAAETMLDLGRLVAEVVAIEEEGFSSRVTMTVAPTVGDLGEVTYDVVGLQDDSLRGLRLVVFGAPTEGGEGFSLKSVEATSLCGRGVTEAGLCT